MRQKPSGLSGTAQTYAASRVLSAARPPCQSPLPTAPVMQPDVRHSTNWKSQQQYRPQQVTTGGALSGAGQGALGGGRQQLRPLLLRTVQLRMLLLLLLLLEAASHLCPGEQVGLADGLRHPAHGAQRWWQAAAGLITAAQDRQAACFHSVSACFHSVRNASAHNKGQAAHPSAHPPVAAAALHNAHSSGQADPVPNRHIHRPAAAARAAQRGTQHLPAGSLQRQPGAVGCGAGYGGGVCGVAPAPTVAASASRRAGPPGRGRLPHCCHTPCHCTLRCRHCLCCCCPRLLLVQQQALHVQQVLGHPHCRRCQVVGRAGRGRAGRSSQLLTVWALKQLKPRPSKSQRRPDQPVNWLLTASTKAAAAPVGSAEMQQHLRAAHSSSATCGQRRNAAAPASNHGSSTCGQHTAAPPVGRPLSAPRWLALPQRRGCSAPKPSTSSSCTRQAGAERWRRRRWARPQLAEKLPRERHLLLAPVCSRML